MSAKINKLTPEQAATMPAFRDEWLRIGLSTERADRPRAEAGVRLAYEAAGLPPPKLVLWLDSPHAGAIGAALLSGTAKAGRSVRAQVRDQVRDQVWDQVGDQVRDQVGAQVGDQVWDQVWAQVGAQVGDQVWDQVWDQVGDQVRDQVWAQVRDQVGDQVRDQVWDQVRDQVSRAAYGQHDANWLAFYDFFRSVGLEAPARLRGQMEVARSAGWWWPFEGAVILTERPTEIHRNTDGRLHNEDGPALLYPDGWGIWALNGLRVDRQIIETPETLTAAQVRDERNAEVRRHMLGRYAGLRGSAAAGQWLSDMGLQPVSSCDITAKMQPSGLSIWRLTNGDAPVLCKLYRAEMGDDEPLVLLTVICTSTAKLTFLRVPPTIKSAEAARNWTFDEILTDAVET